MFLLDEVDFVQTQNLPIRELWYFLPFGYLLTILVETPILLVGLSPKISFKQKLLCGIWLTACTYPIVILVLPTLMNGFPRRQYLTVAETFAPIGACRPAVLVRAFDGLPDALCLVRQRIHLHRRRKTFVRSDTHPFGRIRLQPRRDNRR